MDDEKTALPGNAPVILVDAYSQVFRAFFAISGLSTPDGFPTNALFAFSRILLQLEAEYPGTPGAMLFDCGKPAFRLALEPEYKANRPPMPEELKRQMPVLREMIAAFGWPVWQQEGWEADDLIGALCKELTVLPIRIVSADKDLSQLIDDRVQMLIPAHKGSGFEVRDAAATLAKFSLPPERIAEYLALIGDTADNIAGVPGVGPKTAVKLLTALPSLEAALADPEQIADEKLRAKVLPHAALLHRNLALVRLRQEWPAALPTPQEAVTRRTPDWAALKTIADRYLLRGLGREAALHLTPKSVPEPPAAAPAPDDLPLFAAVPAPAEEPEKAPEPAPQTPWTQGDLFGN